MLSDPGLTTMALQSVAPGQAEPIPQPTMWPPGVAAVIPAWQPDDALYDLVRRLADRGCTAIVLVDDGSGGDYQPVFQRAAEFPHVAILRHAINMGKGRALRTAFNFVLTSLPGIAGVVTADADGQHAVDDIVRVAVALADSGRRCVLGVRNMAGGVPLRSRFGNTVTRYVFRFLTGRKVSDTQTGLRGFPVNLLPELLALPGERYEYEMTVLAHLCRRGAQPIEIPIASVYLDGNRSSHFDPVRDSMRIYFVLLRFYASSLIAAGIDFVGFSVAFAATGNLLASMIFGRLSSIVNFMLNRGFVFQSETRIGSSVWRYYLLACALGTIAYAAIRTLSLGLGWNVIACKILVETLLSLVSFSVQQTFVFPAKQEE